MCLNKCCVSFTYHCKLEIHALFNPPTHSLAVEGGLHPTLTCYRTD